MAGKLRRVGRATAIAALMLGIAPASSAIGQETRVAGNGDAAAPESPVGTVLGHQFFTEAKALSERLAAEAAENRRIDGEIMSKAGRIGPGQYVWQADRVAGGPVEMVVSLPQQRIYVYRAHRLIAVSTVSSGRPGHTTPTGHFPILQKKIINYSTLYDSAPMPHMQRLTWDGVALHAGRIPGVPASHGCIRLPAAFASLLYGISTTGQMVHVINTPVPSAGEALAYAKTPGAIVRTRPTTDPAAARDGASRAPAGGGTHRTAR